MVLRDNGIVPCYLSGWQPNPWAHVSHVQLMLCSSLTVLHLLHMKRINIRNNIKGMALNCRQLCFHASLERPVQKICIVCKKKKQHFTHGPGFPWVVSFSLWFCSRVLLWSVLAALAVLFNKLVLINLKCILGFYASTNHDDVSWTTSDN